MPFNFQFTFLGCQHNYIATVTKISNEGVPQDASLTETYGLPITFASKMINREHQKRFFYNVRGHDFLSYSGQFRGKSDRDVGHVETAYVQISESSVLESLRSENEDNHFLGPNMIVSLGPRPGSVFVKAYSMERYGWENLPADLSQELLKIYARGYNKGIIQDVAMNATGGWVVLLDGGKRFAFGGRLPFQLRMILQNAQDNKSNMPKLDTSIYRVYLNHQHPEEYILIFNDGQCFVKLHSEFRTPIERLLNIWGKETHKKFHVAFTSSSTISEYTQSKLNAWYYSHRGLFFLSRLNEMMALHYLREASDQDCSNSEIRDNYWIALIAMRRREPRDQLLEDLIKHHHPTRAQTHRPPPVRPENQDENKFFRAEYMWMLAEQDIDTTAASMAALERRLDDLQRPYLDNRWNLGSRGVMREWSYEMGIAGNEKSHYELDVPDAREEMQSNPLFEIEGHEVTVNRIDTHVSELSSSVDEIEVIKAVEVVPQRRRIILDAPVWEKPKSRNPFNRIFKKES